jgi:putative spermidine/putrescine transport system permease protein
VPGGKRRQIGLSDGLPLLPFFAVVVIFLIIPTVTVIVGSVYADGVFSFARIQALFSGTALSALAKSVLLSGSTAIIGAILGAVLAWLVVSSPPTSMVRRAVISLCSVLAQFGGVALAFAFLATVGLNGVLTLWVQQLFGFNLAGSGWLYSLTGLILVYTYFQIPLMVIVFVPALEGLRDQWREAAVSLGASTWRYWREVAIPLLTPAFLGSALLLFANAFAAYATAAALVSQGSPTLGGKIFRAVLWVAFGLFFLFPLYAMADFSTRNLIAGGRTVQAWKNLVADEALYQAIVISLLLAVFTVVAMLLVLVPTMIWVRLRAPWAKGMVEFLCLLPLTIPALVIVVGLRNVYLWVTYFLGESALTLTFVYVVLVLPFAYRAIDAALSSIDLQTLAEAARSLGAGWPTTILRVVVPNIWSGILSAAFISIAVVLGEYTIASLSGYQTLQVQIVAIGKSDGPTSVAASLAVLLFGFVLLLILSAVTRGRRRSPVEAAVQPGVAA